MPTLSGPVVGGGSSGVPMVVSGPIAGAVGDGSATPAPLPIDVVPTVAGPVLGVPAADGTPRPLPPEAGADCCTAEVDTVVPQAVAIARVASAAATRRRDRGISADPRRGRSAHQRTLPSLASLGASQRRASGHRVACRRDRRRGTHL